MTGSGRSIAAVILLAASMPHIVQAQSYVKTETIEYHDDLSLWVVGQVKRTTTNGIESSRTDYDWLAMPTTSYVFGRRQQTLGYYTDGTVATIKDGNDYITTASNWKRGIPQMIQYPATAESPSGATVSASVNDLGWPTTVTNEVGSRTCYGYDAMGRISQITYPSETTSGVCDTSAWNANVRTFQPVAAPEFGIEAGHWRHSVSLGASRKDVYFDALWRPLLMREYDTANVAGTQRMTAFAYDHVGCKTFTSYAVASAAAFNAITMGVHTSYDVLGRVRVETQDSELGPLNTYTDYLTGGKTRVTNPRLQSTTTSYVFYDEPVYDRPVWIEHPEGAYTQITRDVFGKTTVLTRRNADSTLSLSRGYAYDAYQRLCRIVEPESGARLTGYDGAGNVAWSAAGLPLDTPCEPDGTSLAVAARKVVQGHDARNRVVALAFPDLDGNQSWAYTPDGLPSQVTTLNERGSQAVVNTYGYNKRRQLTSESVGQTNWPTRSLGYGYDANGNLTSHTYPGLTVDYAPNALGQPTRAGGYATGVLYHPNGAMAQFTYGNGLVHTLTQNARGLPDRSSDSYAGTAVLDDSYDYDTSGNVAAISDGLPGNRGNRDMTYDGLDRLLTTNSPMFGAASYAYDVLDNLTHVIVTGGNAPRDQHYCYDGSWRLTNVKTGGCSGTTVLGLGYDEQGNLNNRSGKDYRFDYGNRLRESESNTSGGETYRYDAYGRRVLAMHGTKGAIASMYAQDGSLRFQQNQREARNVSYILLNGSLVARASDIVLPDAPSVTVPSFVTVSAYLVQWSAVPGSTSYEVQESTNGGPWIAFHSGAGTSKSASGKASGTYGYRARSCNAAGCGVWGATASVSVQLPPATPPSLSVPAMGFNGAYSVDWGSSVGATTYTLEESFNGGSWTVVHDVAGQSRSFSGRPEGSFTYRIRACNPVGCSGWSAVSSLQVLYAPSTAPGISAPASSGNGSYAVTWVGVAGAATYQLEEQVNGSGWTLVQDSAVGSRNFAGRSNAIYGYRARACNSAGCGPYSGTVSITVLLPPTAAPGLSVPASNGTGSYSVGWTGVDTASSYQLEESVNGGAWTLIHNGGGNGVSLSGRSTATYGYRVRACNWAGCGPDSPVQYVAVDLAPPMPGDFKARYMVLTVNPPIQTTWRFNWTAVPGATRYEIRRGTGSSFYNGAANSYQWVTSGGPGSTGGYQFSLRACNAVACSGWFAVTATEGFN